MEIKTHHKIDQNLCGAPIELKCGFSRVELILSPEMKADDTGLVHGGFIFGLADYAAMIAVNHPNVVLGAATVKFLKPAKVNDIVVAEAAVKEISAKKHSVEVSVFCEKEKVFEGTFVCFVLDKHVLS